MISLLDGDLIAYRCAASCKPDDPLDIAIYRADKLTRDILQQTEAANYLLFISDKTNFRYIIYPEYKATRQNIERPRWLGETKEFLLSEWKGILTKDVEADDELAMHQTEDTIICSLDKDLRMVKGRHFSWEIAGPNWIRPAEFFEVSFVGGVCTFFKQMLIGDTSDNIIGVNRIGSKTADKLLNTDMSFQEMFKIVYEKYDDPKRFAVNATCLWMMHKRGETWHNAIELILPNELQQEVDQISKSMKYLTSDT